MFFGGFAFKREPGSEAPPLSINRWIRPVIDSCSLQNVRIEREGAASRRRSCVVRSFKFGEIRAHQHGCQELIGASFDLALQKAGQQNIQSPCLVGGKSTREECYASHVWQRRTRGCSSLAFVGCKCKCRKWPRYMCCPIVEMAGPWQKDGIRINSSDALLAAATQSPPRGIAQWSLFAI